MLYWRIRQPGKSWRNWAEGTAEDENDIKESVITSLMSGDDQLPDWAAMGVNVEVYKMVDTDDIRITPQMCRAYWNENKNIEEIA